MRLWILLVPVLLASQAASEDRLRIDIDKPGRASLRFAVQRFRPVSGAEDPSQREFDRFLIDGLDFSGLIKVIDRGAFLEPEVTQDDHAARVPCENWAAIGADALVEGSVELREDRTRVRFRLWDIPRCQLQGDATTFEAPHGQVRWLARRIADELVLRFTGRRGVAATRIAFASDQSGSREIYMMEADGSEKRPVTNNGSMNFFPSWSADGDSIVYTSYRTGTPDLYVLSRGRRRSGRLLDESLPKYRGVFSPVGNGLAVVMADKANTDIFLVKRSGRGLTKVTTSRSIEVSPSWSPDGKRLALVSDRSGSPQVYVHDIESGKTERLTFRGSYNASPAWSPTGEWIVFAAQTGANFDLYLISPETGYTTPLVVHPRSDEDPVWAPDGRKIAFVSSRRGLKDIYTVDLAGGNVRRITRDFGNCTTPAWSPWLD